MRKYYEEHRSEYQTEEQRALRYVFLPQPKDLDKLKAEEQEAAKRKHNEEVTSFYDQAIQNPARFDEQAKSRNLAIKETPLFSVSQPPDDLKSAPELVEAAFSFPFSKETTVGDPVKAADGYYLYQLKPEQEAAREMKFEEAQEKVKTTLVESKAKEAVIKLAEETKGKLEEALKANKPFAAAAEELKLKPVAFAHLTRNKPSSEKHFAEALTAGLEMKTGSLSKAIPVADGAILVHLEKREMYKNPAASQEMAQLTEGMKSMNALRLMEVYFRKWREEGKIKFHQAPNAEG